MGSEPSNASWVLWIVQDKDEQISKGTLGSRLPKLQEGRSSEIVGENTISMISSKTRKCCQYSSSNGTRLPIINGRYLPKHHICAAVK